MDNILKQFYENSPQRDAVQAFMIEQLREMAVERVFDKKAISGIYEARKVVDIAFDKLEELYAVKKPSLPESSR
jgi:hypothetical protein